MGYDGLFLGRIDYEDLAKRFSNRNTEMIWQPSKSLGSKINLFTSILSNGYYPPPGFCFDRLCAHEPITDANVDRKVETESEKKNIKKHCIDFWFLNAGGRTYKLFDICAAKIPFKSYFADVWRRFSLSRGRQVV